uniref:SEC16 homolog B, endoplasmic reticulum export factor n=1 Tax=Pundamilia nyererei TaxID=303518 RepID=A0A3B4GZK4_9CICH
MDHRGHYWPDSGCHSHRTKDREGYTSHSQQERDQLYPPPDLRERDRHWGHPDARYNVHFPLPTPDFYPYNSQQYQYGYGPEHQRPLSRFVQLQVTPTDSSQHYLNDFEDNPSRDNEEISSFYLGTLESSKNSGLSSSSYELSQYMNGAEHSDAAPQPYGAHVHQMSAPLKYSIPHAVISFGPAGQLIRVTTGPGVSYDQRPVGTCTFSGQQNGQQVLYDCTEQVRKLMASET